MASLSHLTVAYEPIFFAHHELQRERIGRLRAAKDLGHGRDSYIDLGSQHVILQCLQHASTNLGSAIQLGISSAKGD